MSNRIALVTDSTCDIPAEWVAKYELQVVPLTIVFNGQPYLDGVELSADAFYVRLARENSYPTTSQPTPGAFLEAYRRAVAAGAEEIVAITISEAMSGTIGSARQAAAECGVPVTVLDSKNNSLGLGWQVIAAARAREAGGGLSEMLTAAGQARQDMVYYISLDTIEYLARGGRISEAARFLDSILKIKPLIYVNPETGKVGASMPARSRKSAIAGLYSEFFRHIPPGRRLHIAVLHNNALPEAEELAGRVKTEYAPAEIIITIVSPALGVHTGPRAIALCGYAER
jgi:DegV family protein with EDD domain